MPTDPFAHGTPAGDHHTWIDPGRLPCPDCPCCTVNLCTTAAERGRTCAEVGGQYGPPRAGYHDLRGCPCATKGGERGA